MKVSTRSVLMGKAQVSACLRCAEKLGLGPKAEAPGIKMAKATTDRDPKIYPICDPWYGEAGPTI